MSSKNIVDPDQYGVSFSIKQCRNFRLDWRDCLGWALDMGWRRFRLMSYWNEIEKEQELYDFRNLDEQIQIIAEQKGVITLCLGVKQPRWPEYHWPKWALELPANERDTALIQFIQAVVEHYKNQSAIISYQLENEALLKGFGSNIEVNRRRLRAEYNLVKKLDPSRPIIMSTSNGWGIPIRKPRPNIIGFSYYPIMYVNGKYRTTVQRPWLHRLRKIFTKQPVFIHELQLEPWGPTAIWKMDTTEQDKSMNAAQIAKNLAAAHKINAHPVDIWGLEWWYWRLKTHSDPSIWQTVSKNINKVS